MIISHKHKFIFLKTPKTASTSIELALRSICEKDDIITTISTEDEAIAAELGLLPPQNFHISATTSDDKFYNHISAPKVRYYVGEKIWNSYYKFCFERNPFDKAISFYYWLTRRKSSKDRLSLSDFIQQGFLKGINSFEIYTINKIVAVDDIFKYEEMEQAFEVISQKLKLKTPLKILSYKAKSTSRQNREHYSKVLTKEDKRIIEIMFAREICLMEYEFDMEQNSNSTIKKQTII